MSEMSDRPQLQLSAPSASPEEAAAVVAALERFMRATAPAVSATVPEPDRWTQVAILEGVEREEPLSGFWVASPRH
jgi:hypothetical protein